MKKYQFYMITEVKCKYIRCIFGISDWMLKIYKWNLSLIEYVFLLNKICIIFKKLNIFPVSLIQRTLAFLSILKYLMCT